MATTDLLQRINEAIVAALDSLSGICNLTLQPAANVVPHVDNLESLLVDDRKGLIAYHVVDATRGGGIIGDFRRVLVQFFAVARSEAVANALLEQVEQGFTCVRLAALGTPLDARVFAWNRRSLAPDPLSGIHAAILECPLIAKR